jgi:hypothetical protein
VPLNDYLKIAGELTAVAVVLGPLVEFVVTLIVWLASLAKKTVPAVVKQLLAGVLSIGGAALVAGAGGIVPWPQVWIGAVFGLASWLLANANHKASVANTEAPA